MCCVLCASLNKTFSSFLPSFLVVVISYSETTVYVVLFVYLFVFVVCFFVYCVFVFLGFCYIYIYIYIFEMYFVIFTVNSLRKEGNVLFNDPLNTFYLRLYGVAHMVKDHSDSKRKPAAAHGLHFPISSKGSFICTIPQTG